MKLCSVCRVFPKMPRVTRCVRCQSVFNRLRKVDPSVPSGGGERRRAPTTAEIRAYIQVGSNHVPPVKAAAEHPTRQPQASSDHEVRDALGVLRDWRAQQAGRAGYVYCIAEESTAIWCAKGTLYSDATQRPLFVKIGYSTNPEARLGELQTGNPRKLVLLGKLEGTTEDEERLHREYIDDNVLGEWFQLSEGLLAEFPSDDGAIVDGPTERTAA